jgi:uncharacterized protein (DUF58 family)
MAYFPLQLINTRPAARRQLSFSTGDEPVLECSIEADGTTEIAFPVSARQRGWLALPRLRLATVYPLGLFVAWSYLQPNMRCLVYPQPLTSPLPSAAPTSRNGQDAGTEGEDDFAGFRERQPADSPRHVAWKASARAADERPLLLKQFSGGAATELCLDWASTAEGLSIETRLSRLTGWVLAAEAASLSYGLRLPGSEIQTGSGPAHRQHCLETLALFQQ